MNKGYCIINKNIAWKQLSGKHVVGHRLTIMKDLGYILPFKPTPIITSKQIVLHNCDKNFVYYWLLPLETVFPNVDCILLNSHPCEFRVLNMLQKKKHINVYLTKRWWKYKERWVPGATNFYKINDFSLTNKFY